jgi:hypothetical protein
MNKTNYLYALHPCISVIITQGKNPKCKRKKPRTCGQNIHACKRRNNRSVRQKYTAWISEKKNSQCHKQNAECKRKVPSVGKNKLTRDKYTS